MIKLIVPNEAYLQSYQEAYDEYLAHRVSTYSFTDPSSCDIFAKFQRYREERDLPPNRVGEDKYWLVDDEKQYFIGEIAIRHRLNDALAQRGGHIGYGVRYSEWNRGYGTKMLALALEKAKGMRISPVLITCNDDNLASARVMEKYGFVLGDTIPVSIDGTDYLTRRYGVCSICSINAGIRTSSQRISRIAAPVRFSSSRSADELWSPMRSRYKPTGSAASAL